MITFKQQFTFADSSIKAFAVFLGWQEKLTRQIEITDQEETETQGKLTHFENEEYDNPISFVDYVKEKAREHSLKFMTSWAEKLKADMLEVELNKVRVIAEPQLDEQIVKVVTDALIDEVIIE